MGAGTLDLLLVVALATYAFAGWRRGGVTSLLGLAGLVLGGLLGFLIAPLIIDQVTITTTQATLANAFIVVVVALIGQGSVGALGARVRARQRDKAVQLADSAAGAVVTVASVSVGVWLLATAVQPLVSESNSQAISQSRVLGAVDAVLPTGAAGWSSALRDEIDRSGFPRVFEDASEPVAPPDPGTTTTTTPAVQRAAASVVRIRTAPSECSGLQTGSGWVQAPGRVVTNAHVVAGSGPVTVQEGGRGERLRATVIFFDPQADLAVLAVSGLKAAPLPMTTGTVVSSTDAVIAGYPENGPYRVIPARVGTQIMTRGADIYGDPGATREMYSVAAQVRPGNSGGPMLTTDGRVAGTVFARAKNDVGTGYVLTNDMLTQRLQATPPTGSAVPTGACTPR
ncbi:MarP family serine protease [Yimella sp. cx-51]|uniref:MarP family serine protease n=1 Tax=Yimella sp. cx-51 TaxID=2770551 RepID=UPI00165D678D|nr:MarP family serine protease [Yimella sp. cx-51]MBC9958035.1 MarP family serine protease [Yimella sp. cx-51]QTH38155.1 MarP family serine protease [Yimella sp. cx-51]